MLFCSLTGDQRDLYRAYLSSEEVQDILNVSVCFTDCMHGHHDGLNVLLRLPRLQVLWTNASGFALLDMTAEETVSPG